MKPRRLAPLALALAVTGALLAGLLLPHGVLNDSLAAAARLRAMGPAGWLLFIAAEFATTLIGIVPGALLGILAGALYGVAAGFAGSAIGIIAGAVCAFALSRSVLRPLIAGLLGRNRRLWALDHLVTRDSWRLVALLRISPVMPFSVTSYALGLSGIAARDYVLGTLAALPPLLGYVVIGALGGAGITTPTRDGKIIHAVLLGLGILATVVLTVHLSRLLARALRDGPNLAA
jgi:uncharacterized membrane protein YdjX (TVP38/TMEM64 family)